MDGTSDQEVESEKPQGEWASPERACCQDSPRFAQGPETWYESKGTEHQGLRHAPEAIRATA